MRRKILFLSIPVFALMFTGCNSGSTDPVKPNNLRLQFSGLENPGSHKQYEGWMVVDGQPVSTGKFTIDNDGKMSKEYFSVDYSYLSRATSFLVSVEPNPDISSERSAHTVLAGDFNKNKAALTTGHSRVLGTDLSIASGGFVMATPTNGPASFETSGVWFLNPETGMASLELPALSAAWQYEGWAIINGIPVSTGKFKAATGPDASSSHNGTLPAPGFPGEDFLENAPAGLTFPANLQGHRIVISVEPNPDNSATPFYIKPLALDVPTAATPGTYYKLQNNSLPTGSATKEK